MRPPNSRLTSMTYNSVQDGYRERPFSCRRCVAKSRRTRTIFDAVHGYTWPDGITGRALRNDFTARWHGRERELAGSIDGEMARYRAAAGQGDTDTAVIFTGEGADLIDDVPSAGEIVTRLVAEAGARSPPPLVAWSSELCAAGRSSPALSFAPRCLVQARTMRADGPAVKPRRGSDPPVTVTCDMWQWSGRCFTTNVFHCAGCACVRRSGRRQAALGAGDVLLVTRLDTAPATSSTPSMRSRAQALGFGPWRMLGAIRRARMAD